MARRLAPIALLGLAALLPAAPAQATFPGANGGIAYAQAFTDELGTPTSGLSIAAPSRDAESVPSSRPLLFCDPNAARRCTLSRVRSPSYSADGSRIVFDGGERIAVVDADGRNLTVLPAVTADDGDPAFSPDGRRIVFTGENAAGGTDLYVRRVDGRRARLVVEDAAEPAWSSRGALAWVRDRRVHVSAPDGARERRVTRGITPDWSPNGRRLVLVRPAAPQRIDGRVHVVRPSGRGLRPVRGVTGSDPVWAPNGRALAFDILERGVFVKRLGRRGLRIVAESQAGDSGSHTDFHPAWRPLTGLALPASARRSTAGSANSRLRRAEPQLRRARQPLDPRLLAERFGAVGDGHRARELDRQAAPRVAARRAGSMGGQAALEVGRPPAVEAVVGAAKQVDVGHPRKLRGRVGGQRSELNTARTSVEKSSGSSQAAKWPPLSTSLKYARPG
jgi:TolB protein